METWKSSKIHLLKTHGPGILKTKHTEHKYRPCSHQDENLSLALAKKQKFCNDQFFVFVILFAHEDATFFFSDR